MRVTLVNPPRFFEIEPNLGLFYIASVMGQAGHDVAIVDKPINKPVGKTWDIFNETLTKTIEEVSGTKPDLIGMTATYHTHYALKLLDIFKKVLPETKIVVGGPHFTFTAEDVLSNYSAVDYVVRGEGEYTMMKLATALEEDRAPGEMDGLSYRHGGKVVSNPDAPLIENLDELPYPARHLVNLEEYPEDSRITLISSRGCPYNCVFCVSPKFWRRYRPRSVENVLGELTQLAREYSPTRVNFVDDTFAVNRERTVRLCQGMEKKEFSFPWTAMIRVIHADRELLQTMYNAGCRLLCFGAESGDDTVLGTIGEDMTTTQVESTVKMALDIGFEAVCSFMINLPYESAESVRATIRFAKKLKAMGAKIQGHLLAPHPGTAVYDSMGKYNLTVRERGEALWKIMSHPLFLAEEYVPLLSNNLISQQELAELWSEVTTTFDYY